jgi:hypothetical protein
VQAKIKVFAGAFFKRLAGVRGAAPLKIRAKPGKGRKDSESFRTFFSGLKYLKKPREKTSEQSGL